MKKFINRTPSRSLNIFLAILPFALLAIIYVVSSNARLAENPNDKLLPSISQIGAGVDRMALTPSKRTGQYLFLSHAIYWNGVSSIQFCSHGDYFQECHQYYDHTRRFLLFWQQGGVPGYGSVWNYVIGSRCRRLE